MAPKRLRWKLILSYIIPISLALSTLGFYLVYALEEFYLRHLQDDLASEGIVIADRVRDDLAAGRTGIILQGPHASPDTPMMPQARILVLDRTGTLLASSREEDRGRIGQPDSEPGVAEALRGRATRGRQESSVLKADSFYVTLPVRHQGEVVGIIRLSHALVEVETAVRQLRLTIASSVLVAGVLALIIAWHLAGNITRPVEALSSAAHAVAQGDFSQQVKVKTGDELEQLGDSFNQMARRLDELEMGRRSFLADLSHELRSPVGAMRAGVETLRRGAKDDPRMLNRLLQGIDEELARLGRLTSDLVQLSRLEAGPPELHLSAVSVEEVVARAISRYQAEAQGRSISLTAQVPRRIPLVRADADRLMQILANLMDNALKFTPAGGQVVVTAGEAGHDVCITVADTGVGIAAQDLPRVFQRFYQGAGRRFRERPGVGLGLAIVRELVHAQGGEIWAESQEGQGATFTFRLPKA